MCFFAKIYKAYYCTMKLCSTIKFALTSPQSVPQSKLTTDESKGKVSSIGADFPPSQTVKQL